MNGLKTTQHVRDNQKGFTLHMAVYSTMCVLLCVLYQQEQESVQDTYNRILKFLFRQERGEALPDLQGVMLASDCGYWKPNLIFNNILRAEVNIEGTV